MNTTLLDLSDLILQADWLAAESGYADVDDLWASDPDLFVTLATEWRQEHPVPANRHSPIRRNQC